MTISAESIVFSKTTAPWLIWQSFKFEFYLMKALVPIMHLFSLHLINKSNIGLLFFDYNISHNQGI